MEKQKIKAKTLFEITKEDLERFESLTPSIRSFSKLLQQKKGQIIISALEKKGFVFDNDGDFLYACRNRLSILSSSERSDLYGVIEVSTYCFDDVPIMVEKTKFDHRNGTFEIDFEIC